MMHCSRRYKLTANPSKPTAAPTCRPTTDSTPAASTTPCEEGKERKKRKTMKTKKKKEEEKKKKLINLHFWHQYCSPCTCTIAPRGASRGSPTHLSNTHHVPQSPPPTAPLFPPPLLPSSGSALLRCKWKRRTSISSSRWKQMDEPSLSTESFYCSQPLLFAYRHTFVSLGLRAAHFSSTQTVCVLASARAEWRSWQIVTRLHYVSDDESNNNKKSVAAVFSPFSFFSVILAKASWRKINKIIISVEKAKPWVRTEEALVFSHVLLVKK